MDGNTRGFSNQIVRNPYDPTGVTLDRKVSEAAKDGASDGVSGDMTYRVYLGENTTNNFDVIGDKVYSATLNLSWNGMWEGPWRVTSSGWADSRALVISAAANSSDPMITQNTKAGSAKVRKGTPTAFYMNFFPNGTSGSVAHSRKDQSSWPYGWVAYVDGSSVYMSGTSGIIKTPSNENLISWSYNTTTDCLSMETIPGAPTSAEIHTLQFKTVDGRKESNMVYFTTSIPFEFRWRDDGVPNHVAQRGILEALDADTHAVDAQGIFHIKDGYTDKVRLQFADSRTAYNGTVAVELLDPFVSVEDAIYIEDSDGDRHCDVPLEARLPWFECSNLWTTYVDASVNLKFSYYACTDDATPAKSSTRMVVVNPGSSSAIVAGANLDYALITEGNRLTPLATCTNNKLGFTTTLNPNDGTLNINTYIATYKGLVPSGNYFNVDQASICINGHASDRGTHNTTFVAWNPWKNINKNISGDVLDDYTLYCVPNQANDTPNYGWKTSGIHYSPPTPADNTTLNIQNPVVANEGNITFNTLFDGTDSYLGNICTIDPDKPLYKTSANYDPSTWTLVVDITDPVAYDKQRLYDYLYGRGYTFYDIYDMDMQLQEYDYSFIIGGSYASSSAAWNDTPSGVSESTPSTVQGTTFRVYSNAGRSEWGMIYGMEGISKSDITTHGAGKINMLMRIHNTHDDSYLEWKIAEAWMRLHVYVWPVAYPPQNYHYSGTETYSELSTADWCFSVSLWAPVGNAIGLYELFSGTALTKPEDEIYNGVFIAGSAAANAGMINQYQSTTGSCTWGIIGHRNVNTANELRSFLSDSSLPYVFKSQGQLDAQAPDVFYRASSTVLYMDPSGSEGRYSKGSDPNTSKLFVINLTTDISAVGIRSNIYYFGKENGF